MLVSSFGSIAPVTGVYSDWSHWSRCSASCGGGTQERTRKCFFSKEAQGGVDCSSLGPSLETRECNALLCPGKRTSLPCCKGMWKGVLQVKFRKSREAKNKAFQWIHFKRFAAT